MTETGPTTDEIVEFVLANRPEQPDPTRIKDRVNGTGQEHVVEALVQCSHDNEKVHEQVRGRWGCLKCYSKLREEEDVWLKKMKDEDRDAQLKDILKHNKQCWEQLGDWTPGGPERSEQYYDRWAKIRRDSGYKGDWVKYVRFDPKFKKVNIRPPSHDGVPCPQGREINGTRLCQQHWKQNRQDNGDLANERHKQRHEECKRIRDEAEALMGGFAANCNHEHPWTTFNELGVEFDHAFPPPENGFDVWEVNRGKKATPKEKASTRILKKVTNPFSSK
ncbi:MAG: hypothetical protein OHK93_000121 [Ramalina farinacea]|uniref:Uncharacterized protein n=1 Tax=Ramalina farinacea TaxID=258253 RepID=A0AA43QG05_9LECA|nr:hypothetical protein [Ramalina farinacea]